MACKRSRVRLPHGPLRAGSSAVERFTRIEEVEGSTPSQSTLFYGCWGIGVTSGPASSGNSIGGSIIGEGRGSGLVNSSSGLGVG